MRDIDVLRDTLNHFENGGWAGGALSRHLTTGVELNCLIGGMFRFSGVSVNRYAVAKLAALETQAFIDAVKALAEDPVFERYWKGNSELTLGPLTVERLMDYLIGFNDDPIFCHRPRNPDHVISLLKRTIARLEERYAELEAVHEVQELVAA